MSTNKKQFGVWMDSQNAIVVGRENVNSGDFKVIGYAKNSGTGGNSSENAANNHEQALAGKYFKDITSLMQNIDEIEVTGTGQVQEQFIKYLSDTAQYKNVVATESTSNKMSDEKFVAFIAAKFN